MKIIVNDDINMIIFLNKIYLNQIDFEDKEKISEKIIKAAIVGTYLHGKAAEAATTDMSPHSVLQEDIINSIGGQIKKLL